MAKIQEFLNVEDEFFELDKDKRVAYMKLEFARPDDIFDKNSITKMPVLSDDFLDWVNSSFDLSPKNYKIDLEVSFDDMQGYDNERLQTIFRKNMLLEYKKTQGKARTKNIVAFSLIGIGVVFFVAMFLVTNLWKEGGLAKDIFSYIADIATTVTIWEAMAILVVENKERRSYMKNLYSRFRSIEFKQKEQPHA